jgi:outer membrane protein OmpA-like peptidoglycan-associated protein
MTKIQFAACSAVLCFLLPLMAYGAEDVNLKGIITGRTGDSMTLKTPDAGTVTVVLNDDTKVRVPKGLLKVRHENMSMAELIPGLPVQVKGTKDETGQLVAKEISFGAKDLKTANAIQAGLAPTQQNVQENKEAIASNQQSIAANQQQISANQMAVEQRFANLTDYDVKATTTVYFNTGSAVLSDKDKTQLADLARTAASNKGYMLQVKGYADSTGKAAQNQVLSKDRAEAVVAYLIQDAKVPLRQVLAPGAMGTVEPAASNETPAGRKENRRVEVKVLVNRGVAGTGAGPGQ